MENNHITASFLAPGIFLGFAGSCILYVSWPIAFIVGFVFSKTLNERKIGFTRENKKWILISSGLGIFIGGLYLWGVFIVASQFDFLHIFVTPVLYFLGIGLERSIVYFQKKNQSSS